MKNKWTNQTHAEGWIFDHTLENHISKKNVPYIRGELQIATDSEATNIVRVYFTYVTEKYKSGNVNQTYNILQEIIDHKDEYTYEAQGQNARKVRVDGNIEINDFYDREGNLVSPQRFSGRFIHFMNSSDPLDSRPATFNLDMVITNVNLREVEDGENYLELSGYGFDFFNALLPVRFTLRNNKNGIDYFLGQDISRNTPMVTEVWGDIRSTTIKKEKTVESAWGNSSVDTTTQTIRSWDLVGSSKSPMTWGDANVITAEDMKKAVQTREEYLADVKKRHDEYMASSSKTSNKSSAFDSAPTTSSDDFVF